MSCDFAVWHTEDILDAAAAAELYGRLCAGDTSGVVEHPGIVAFYEELTSKHPELDDVPADQLDNTDLCPWSIAHDRSEGHVQMSCVWSKADYVHELVMTLARKHGLAFFDPQSGEVHYSDASPPER
jgi:hypothetical protein